MYTLAPSVSRTKGCYSTRIRLRNDSCIINCKRGTFQRRMSPKSEDVRDMITSFVPLDYSPTVAAPLPPFLFHHLQHFLTCGILTADPGMSNVFAECASNRVAVWAYTCITTYSCWWDKRLAGSSRTIGSVRGAEFYGLFLKQSYQCCATVWPDQSERDRLVATLGRKHCFIFGCHPKQNAETILTVAVTARCSQNLRRAYSRITCRT